MQHDATSEPFRPGQTITHCLHCGYWLRGLPDRGRCPECGQPYDKFAGLWSNGHHLLMLRAARPLQRCMICNIDVPPSNVTQRTLTYRNAWLYLLFLALCLLQLPGLVLIFILMLVLRRRVHLWMGICDRHVKRQRTGKVIAVIGLTVAIALICAAVAEDHSPYSMAAGICAVMTILISLTVDPSVRIAKLDKRYVRLTGVHPDYLDALPSFQIPPSGTREQ